MLAEGEKFSSIAPPRRADIPGEFFHLAGGFSSASYLGKDLPRGCENNSLKNVDRIFFRLRGI